jgi:DNA-binding NtrC family response regulator
MYEARTIIEAAASTYSACETKGASREGNVSSAARILIVDDDENIRRLLSSVLGDEGYVVDAAGNGAEAIQKAEAKFYDLAFIDMRLPDTNGLELLTHINRINPNTIKIILTGYPSPQNSMEASKRGAVGYMIKPVEMDKLLRTAKEHLQKQKETPND